MSQAQVNAIMQAGKDVRHGLERLASAIDSRTRLELLDVIAKHGEDRIKDIAQKLEEGIIK